MDKTELLRIAWDVAKREAMQYVEQERDREKPLSFDFVIITMVGHIGQALFDAGHSYESLTFEERHLIATLALLDAGYMDLQEKDIDGQSAREKTHTQAMASA